MKHPFIPNIPKADLVETGFVFMNPTGTREGVYGLTEEFNPLDECHWEGSGTKTISVWLTGNDGHEIWFSCN